MRHDDPVVEIARAKQRARDAHVRRAAADDDRVDAAHAQLQVEVGLVEGVPAALGEDDVALGGRHFRRDLRRIRALGEARLDRLVRAAPFAQVHVRICEAQDSVRSVVGMGPARIERGHAHAARAGEKPLHIGQYGALRQKRLFLGIARMQIAVERIENNEAGGGGGQRRLEARDAGHGYSP